jgi:SOS-response transcriptional repressor LexA
MTIAERVKKKRTELGLTQAELAKRVGITQQSLQKIEDGRTQNPRKLISLSKEIGCDPEWLLLGTAYEVRENPSSYNNRTPSQQSLLDNQRPIITALQAAAWPVHKNLSNHSEWLDSPIETSRNAFWLTVIGDSMTSVSGISIPEGYLILVEPNQNAKNGDLVVADTEGSNEVTFKKLVIDAGQTYLKPLNPSYRPIEVSKKVNIIGVVKQARALF